MTLSVFHIGKSLIQLIQRRQSLHPLNINVQPLSCQIDLISHGVFQFSLTVHQVGPHLLDPVAGASMFQPGLIIFQILPQDQQTVFHGPVHFLPVISQGIKKGPDIRYRQLRRSGRSRRPQIRHIICNGGICLMPYSRDHRRLALENSPGYCFFVKGPEIFYGASASSYNYNIYAQSVQGLNSLYNALYGPFSLDKGRIKDQLHIGIPPACNVPDVLDGRPGRRSDHADLPGVFRDRLLIFLGEHAHLLQLFFQRQKALIKKPCPFQGDLPGIKLVFPVPLIDTDTSPGHHPVSVFHGKSQAFSLAGKHHTGNGPGLIFQREINMP